MSSAELKMPPEAFEAFRGPPQEFINNAVALAGDVAHDAEQLSVTVSNHQGQRRIVFEFVHGLWHFKGFVRPKSGEVVLQDVNWGGQ